MPRGCGRPLAQGGLRGVTELAAGEPPRSGGAQVRAVPAVHDGRGAAAGREGRDARLSSSRGRRARLLRGRHRPVRRDGRAGPARPGADPGLGLGAEARRGAPRPRARRPQVAARCCEPRIAVPIHWGTFFPRGRRDRARRLTDPPHEFASAAARAGARRRGQGARAGRRARPRASGGA